MRLFLDFLYLGRTFRPNPRSLKVFRPGVTIGLRVFAHRCILRCIKFVEEH